MDGVVSIRFVNLDRGLGITFYSFGLRLGDD